MARLDRVQQTSQDAKAASQAAATAARKAEHEILNVQKQNAQLRDRIKDLENKQKVPNLLLLDGWCFYSFFCHLCIVNRAQVAAAKNLLCV